jgi:hypothetical protein
MPLQGGERKEALVSVQPSSGATSSAGETLRALAMLACLIALPLAALRGAKWSDLKDTVPAMVKRVLNCRWDSSAALAKESEAPPWPSPGRGNAGAGGTLAAPAAEQSSTELSIGPGVESTAVALAAPKKPGAGPDSQPLKAQSPGDEASRVTEGSLFAPRFADAERFDSPDAVRPTRQRMDSSLDRASLVPVSRRERDVATPRSLRPFPTRISEVETADRSNTSAPAVDRFTYCFDRLRELGAVYYLLETWGSEGQRFRFHCKMAIGGNPGYTRHFEATDAEPMQAIARVLSEVEAWRAAP